MLTQFLREIQSMFTLRFVHRGSSLPPESISGTTSA